MIDKHKLKQLVDKITTNMNKNSDIRATVEEILAAQEAIKTKKQEFKNIKIKFSHESDDIEPSFVDLSYQDDQVLFQRIWPDIDFNNKKEAVKKLSDKNLSIIDKKAICFQTERIKAIANGINNIESISDVTADAKFKEEFLTPQQQQKDCSYFIVKLKQPAINITDRFIPKLYSKLHVLERNSRVDIRTKMENFLSTLEAIRPITKTNFNNFDDNLKIWNDNKTIVIVADNFEAVLNEKNEITYRNCSKRNNIVITNIKNELFNGQFNMKIDRLAMEKIEQTTKQIAALSSYLDDSILTEIKKEPTIASTDWSIVTDKIKENLIVCAENKCQEVPTRTKNWQQLAAQAEPSTQTSTTQQKTNFNNFLT